MVHSTEGHRTGEEREMNLAELPGSDFVLLGVEGGKAAGRPELGGDDGLLGCLWRLLPLGHVCVDMHKVAELHSAADD